MSQESETILVDTDLYGAYEQYFQNLSGEKSDYILIAGGRNDVVDTIHNIHTTLSKNEQKDTLQSLSFLVLTSDNLDRAADVAQIFLTGKDNIGSIRFASLEDSYTPIASNVMYQDVATDLESGGYDTIQIDSDDQTIE